MLRPVILLSLLAGSVTLPAQQQQQQQQDSPTPRSKPLDYPVRTVVPGTGIEIAAEHLGHSLPVSGGMLFAPDHLVIEVALFGSPDKPVALSPQHFSLTINGRKTPLLPDSPGSVAMSMRDSPMNIRPSLQASGSVGNAGVILGRRPNTGIPDIDARNRGPAPPQAPGVPGRSGAGPREEVDIPAAVTRAALADCICKTPLAGLLYFPYTGKLKSIKSMVLHYTPGGDGQPVSLRLLP
jgi:hypothetical protein